MRIFGCLIWFDEDPRWLASTVASFGKIADHVVAVDGAFFAYPEGRPASGGEQGEAIQAAARAAGLGLTLHVPQTVWYGNEPEKRSCYARIVNALAEPGDWMLVLDGDEELSDVSPLARGDLENATENAATIGFWTTDELRSWYGPTRRLYRVLPGMEYGPSHYSLSAPAPGYEAVGCLWLDGRGEKYGEPLEPALDLTSQIRVEHKHHLRTGPRTEKADVFMNLRPSLEPWDEVSA
jgi:hypothetical protein